MMLPGCHSGLPTKLSIDCTGGIQVAGSTEVSLAPALL